MPPPTDKTQSYTGTNALDQYGSVDLGAGAGAQAQGHDGAGNLTSDGNGRSYSYNSENQMTRATGPGLDMEYWYDADGRRSHSLDYVANTEVFHQHLGQMEVADYIVTREGGQIGLGRVLDYTPTFRIILGAGIDERIAIHDVSGDELSFYLTNHQGSTIAMVHEDGTRLADGSGGAYVYDPYGNEMSGVSSAGQPYRYTGRRLDAQTGLYYYRAGMEPVLRLDRWNPRSGKFLQTDPIGTDDQMNLYGYVGNNPLNAVDPSGLYARGDDTWTDKEWATFDAAQKQASSDISSTLTQLNSAKNGNSDAISAFQETFGIDPNISTGDRISAVIKTLTRIKKALDSTTNYIAYADNLGGNTAGIGVIGGTEINIDVGSAIFQNPDQRALSGAIIHEGGHNVGLIDIPSPTGLGYDKKPYRRGRAGQREAFRLMRILNPSGTIGNPDHIASIVYP